MIGLEDVAYILHSTENNHKRRRDRRAPRESRFFQQLFSHGFSESERATQILALHQSVSRFRLITASMSVSEQQITHRSLNVDLETESGFRCELPPF